MRNDDFEALESLRIVPPAATRKAEREWTGNVKAALASEDGAHATRDCLISTINDSGSWSGGTFDVSDNILTAYGLTYRARSANANDAEQLVRRCAESRATDVLGLAVQTVASRKLGPGR